MNHRVDADRVRPVEHSIHCRVQLQDFVAFQCFEPERHRSVVRTAPAVAVLKLRCHLRPVASHSRVKHGPDTPARAEHVEGFGEAVVVNDTRVDREDSHQQDNVAASKHHAEHLLQNNYLNLTTGSNEFLKNTKAYKVVAVLHSSGWLVDDTERECAGR